MAERLPPTPKNEIDEKLKLLDAHRKEWASVNFIERIQLLRQLSNNILATKNQWVEAACKAKKTETADEEVASLMICLRTCKLLANVLEPAAADQAAGKPWSLAKPPKAALVNNQYRVDVFPWGMKESLAYNGITGQIWLEPGAKLSQGRELRESMEKKDIRLSLVMSAGNQSSIGFGDAIYKLFAENQVVMLKHNPVNEWLAPIYEKVFEPLIKRNFFHQAVGGIEEGAYCCNHPLVDNIHITGSDKTHDAIVWGSLDKKNAPETKLKKTLTSELGCVTPWVIVPGNWSQSDLKYHAANIAGAVVNNDSFNCVAAKVIIFHKGWKLKEAFLKEFEDCLANTPRRFSYYPGAAQRYEQFLKVYPQAKKLGPQEEKPGYLPWAIIRDIPAKEGEYGLCNEAFAPLIVTTDIEANDTSDFLDKSTRFCNENVWGNLSMTILIDPATESANKEKFEKAIENLRYGTVAVNLWSAFGFALATPLWGAFPGNNERDIQSGKGFVHNPFMLDNPQKNVIRVPFKLPFEIKLLHFPNFKNIDNAIDSLLNFETSESFFSILPIFKNLFSG